ncbi:MAG: amidohydrolase family protein [Chloroflexota bacterium]|nr:amidohydrolase family protein [Chloroflexota bacterium]
MPLELDGWLELTQEDVLDPDLPICDPHHHLWDKPGDRYMIDEISRDVGSGHNIVQTVFVEVDAMYRSSGPEEMRPIGESEWVRGIGAQSDSGLYGRTKVATGIVGYANLNLGARVEPVLEAMESVSSGRFRSVRHTCSWDEYEPLRSHRSGWPGMMAETKFREGLSKLIDRGHSFDALVYHPQLSELTELVDAFPNGVFVLNHIGRPLGVGPYQGHRDKVYEVWKKDMAKLAERSNVLVKVGGLGNRVSGFGWDTQPEPPNSQELVEKTSPYYLYTIEVFGPERCMFESNFPVDKNSYSYKTIWNSFKRMTQGFSSTEKTWLFHDTAAKAYRLPALTDR